MNKTQAAFVLTCAKLFALYPRIYFWTFTFKRVMCDWQYPLAWQGFFRDLNHNYGEFILGVKVLEAHKEHGLHYHALWQQRVMVQVARRIGSRYGMGIIQVQKADMGSVKYLAKYLRKDSQPLFGVRRWGTLGGFQGVRKADVEVRSVFHENLAELFKGRQVNFAVVEAVRRQSVLYGPVERWPVPSVQLVYKLDFQYSKRERAIKVLTPTPEMANVFSFSRLEQGHLFGAAEAVPVGEQAGWHYER